MVDVAVLKCERYDDLVFQNISELLDMLPSNKDLFKPDMNVLLKPNIISDASPENAATTHPVIIDAVCKYLSKFNVQLAIGESSGPISAEFTDIAFEKSGIKQIAQKYGAEFVNFDRDKRTIIKNPKAVKMKQIICSERLAQMDVIINICKLKTHTLMGYSGAVKNMFGIIPGKRKIFAHLIGKDTYTFSNILLDIYSSIKPQLNIMDAIIGMEGLGPTRGKIKKTGLLMASVDGIALDYVATNIIGYVPEKLDFIKLAKERKLLPANIRTIGSCNEKIYYEKPVTYGYADINPSAAEEQKQKFMPVLDQNSCCQCGKCVNFCPSKCIYLGNDKYPHYKIEQCIKCYCCHELCPSNAIIIKDILYSEI